MWRSTDEREVTMDDPQDDSLASVFHAGDMTQFCQPLNVSHQCQTSDAPVGTQHRHNERRSDKDMTSQCDLRSTRTSHLSEFTKASEVETAEVETRTPVNGFYLSSDVRIAHTVTAPNSDTFPGSWQPVLEEQSGPCWTSQSQVPLLPLLSENVISSSSEVVATAPTCDQSFDVRTLEIVAYQTPDHPQRSDSEPRHSEHSRLVWKADSRLGAYPEQSQLGHNLDSRLDHPEHSFVMQSAESPLELSNASLTNSTSTRLSKVGETNLTTCPSEQEVTSAVDGYDLDTGSGSLTLPPCRVCGENASGLHYGVNTCDACKGFFRRSLQRKERHFCVGERQCEVRGKKRMRCGFCRYQRCLAVGMSRHAIKIGRYSIHRRSHNSRELELLKQQQDEKRASLGDADVDTILVELMAAGKESLFSVEDYSQEEILLKQLKYSKEYNTFCSFKDLQPQVRQGVHQTLDKYHLDEKKIFVEVHAVEVERYIRRYIRFGKGVPGFKRLSLDDQANLLKTARMEVWFLGAYHGYNAELRVVHLPNGRCVHYDEVDNVIGQNHMRAVCELAQRLKRLKFSAEEMVLLKAVCLMSADRCPLQQPDKVEEIQWLLVRCLLRVLERSHPGHSGRKFAHAVQGLLACRDMKQVSDRARKVDIMQCAYRKRELLEEVVLMCP